MRGEVSNKAFTNRTLKGGRTGGGTRGLLDEFLAKKGLLKYLAEESQNWGRKRQLRHGDHALSPSGPSQISRGG